MKVDEWFASLDRADRKMVLAALHVVRTAADGSSSPKRAVEALKAMWPHLVPLQRALEDDHQELKRGEEGLST